MTYIIFCSDCPHYTQTQSKVLLSKQKTMSVIYILIGVSITVASLFLAAFIWAVKSGQYDDNHTPAVRILFDDTKKNN